MANQKQPTKDIEPGKHGGWRPNSGRKSKAAEFGLAALMEEAWPLEKRKEAIKHLADVIMTTQNGKTKVDAIELLLKYSYGIPGKIDPLLDIDLDADIESMTPEQREVYRLRLMQYLARKGIQS